MTKTFCDRCDIQWDASKLTEVTLPGWMDGTKRLDLCPRCLEHLHREVSPIPKVAPKE